MKRITLLTAAALAVAFVQPVYAGGHSGGGGGGGGHFSGGGGGGGAHFSGGGGAHFSGGGGGARFGGGGGSQFNGTARASSGASFRSAPQMPRTVTQSPSVVQREAPARVQQRAVVNSNVQSFRNRQAPSIAFGGSAPRTVDRNVNVQDNRRVQNANDPRTFNRSDVRRSRPPEDVFRNWDRRHEHVWNHNRYRWYNNSWVWFGGGYADPYFYGDGSTPYYDESDAYTYEDDSSRLPVEYAATDGLATNVQQELARRGYDPGAIDGVIGPQSRDAIAAFQNDQRLPVTGRIDQSLLNALNLN